MACFAGLASGLLALTLLWHIPMMLWDHLDLVPIYQAWREGALSDSDFWRIHGGHLHSAAYAVLLATTHLSGGQPWLDCIASWTLLIAYAGVMAKMAADTFPRGERLAGWPVFVLFFALFPGHLANLQWGWQVAVFLCLLGVAIAVRCLTTEALTWRRNAIALASALAALLSFATAVALVPTALALIALRRQSTIARRVGLMLPWLALGAAIAVQHSKITPPGASSGASAGQMLSYVLNYLGGGVARYFTDIAGWIAAAAIIAAIPILMRVRCERASLPWLGLCLFGLFSAMSVAIGRAGPFGDEHAFATRYVSFSSLFWLGWIGLLGLYLKLSPPRRPRWPAWVAGVVLSLSAVNALHVMKKAARVATQTAAISESIRASYPHVDVTLLASIYFDQPQVARDRLALLHRADFAPFQDKPAAASR